MSILQNEEIYQVLIFVMPGYLFMRVWRLLVPSKDFKLKDHIPEVIVISVIHFALFRLLASQIDKPVTWWILLILFLVPIPVTLAIALKKFRNSKLMQGRILHPESMGLFLWHGQAMLYAYTFEKRGFNWGAIWLEIVCIIVSRG